MKQYTVTVYDLWQNAEIVQVVAAYTENQARNHVLTNASAFRYIIRKAEQTVNEVA